MGDRLRRKGECGHTSTVTVISDGLERVICEDCGNVSFRYEYSVSGDLDRADFARRDEDRILKKLIDLAIQEDTKTATALGAVSYTSSV